MLGTRVLQLHHRDALQCNTIARTATQAHNLDHQLQLGVLGVGRGGKGKAGWSGGGGGDGDNGDGGSGLQGSRTIMVVGSSPVITVIYYF